MKRIGSKHIARVLAMLFLMTGLFLITTSQSKVVAADNAEIDDKIVSIKCAIRKADGDNSLRIVTTIDNEQRYQGLGFEIEIQNASGNRVAFTEHRVKKVFPRIDSKTGGVDYNFSPNVFDTGSSWFATVTVTGIPDSYLDNPILIKPFVTLKGNSSEKVYGQSRYIRMDDLEKGIVSLAVKGDLTNASDTVVKKASATSNVVDDLYFDGHYTHIRVQEADNYDGLPSITTYNVTSGGKTYTPKYRYLYSEVINDQSWYDESDPDDKVIVTAGDMRGFQTLSKENNFAPDGNKETIYLGADIVFNEGKTLTGPTTAEEWKSIGKSGFDENAQPFAGIFDGNMHSISGIYIDESAGILGLFGETADDCEIRNLELKNSYIRSTLRYYNINHTGVVVGLLNGKLDTVKCDTDVTVAGKGRYTGGLVGAASNAHIHNCHFAGRVLDVADGGAEKTNNRDRGGIVGGTVANGYCKIDTCLVTGTIDVGKRAAGFIGFIENPSTAEISNSLFAGSFRTIEGCSTANMGTIYGFRNGGNAIATVTNVYAQKLTAGYLLENVFGNSTPTPETATNSGVTTLVAADLQGAQGYLNMEVDFYLAGLHEDAEWFARADGHPVLTSFADETQPVDLTQTSGVRTCWYKPDTNEPLVIYTAADLRGFQELSKEKNFAPDGNKETIYLGADIVFNEGKTLTGPTTAEEWKSIGKSGFDENAQPFAGIFDGNMHSISGIYIDESAGILGLFGETADDCEIRNLELKNSYIRSTLRYYNINHTGVVVGLLNGKLDTVKCDTDVTVAGKGRYTGGLVGAASNAHIHNCHFAGRVLDVADGGAEKTNNRDRGGIVGGTVANGYCKIDTCLVTGTIDVGKRAAGFIGFIENPSTAEISNSLFAGSFRTIEGCSTANMGTIYGFRNGGNAIATVTNVYAQKLTAGYLLENVFGNSTPTPETATNSGVTTLSVANLTGDQAYINTYLDFYVEGKNDSGVWFAAEDSHPILKSFAGTSKQAELSADIYWFDAEDTETTSYTLDDAAEFRGFQKLAANEDFHGIEIKLGADIDLNPKWKVDDKKVAEYVWIPIGRSSIDTSVVKPFRGTFNGQGHTISGVYVESALDRIGLFAMTGLDAVIQDFTLENSVIKSTKTSNTGAVGSIVGRLLGTLDTVKSNANVQLAGSEYCGGLVGDVTADGGALITNCWFAGDIKGAGPHRGGILGGVHVLDSNNPNNPTCTIEHSLITGNIDLSSDNVGGICGSVWSYATLTIKDTLFAGTLNKLEGVTPGQIGMIVGHANNGMLEIPVADVCTIIEPSIERNIGSGQTKHAAANANITRIEMKRLYLEDAVENTNLKIYLKGQDMSSDGTDKQYWWYVSDTHPILASFGTPVTYDKLKVATYNIGSCVKNGNDNHASVRADIVKFMKDNNLDVCMLQEVDGSTSRTGYIHQAEKIAEELSLATGDTFYCKYVETLKNHINSDLDYINSYGIAIISRYQITNDVSEDSVVLEWKGTDREPRALLRAMIDVNGTETAVICTHFDNSASAVTTYREDCVDALIEMLADIGEDTPVIFGGDLNQASGYGDKDNTVIIRDIGEHLTSVTKSRTDAPTHLVGSTWYQLDYIFTNNLVNCGYATAPIPTISIGGEDKELSDHRPLVVNLYLNVNKEDSEE